MSVVYSIGGCVLGGSGIGRTAGFAVDGLVRHNVLNQVIAANSTKPTVGSISVTRVPSHIPGLRHFLPQVMVNTVGDALHGYLTAQVMHTDADAFHGWAGMALPAIQKAKKRNMRVVLERASTHILQQKQILDDEYKVRQITSNAYNMWQVHREVREYELADQIIVPSTYAKKSFVDLGFKPESITVIPFGVSSDFLNEKPRESILDKEPYLNALYVGEVGFRKGILYALEAWTRLSVPKGQFYVVGPIIDQIKPFLGKYAHDDTIVFTGFTDPKPYYTKSHVFLFPSLEEGSALVTYEAMAQCLALVTTDNAGSVMRDGTDGLLVKPQNVDSIVNALTMLSTDLPLTITYGLNARSHVEDYTWDRYGDTVASLYQ
ncbi:glycosyltransferase family 4 protein [candidate division WWE3 bacterium]|nr:glycosyltransferase family 4 protein [candidate division WWE3 bacterium]